jgi:hypothetical protein
MNGMIVFDITLVSDLYIHTLYVKKKGRPCPICQPGVMLKSCNAKRVSEMKPHRKAFVLCLQLLPLSRNSSKPHW